VGRQGEAAVGRFRQIEDVTQLHLQVRHRFSDRLIAAGDPTVAILTENIAGPRPITMVVYPEVPVLTKVRATDAGPARGSMHHPISVPAHITGVQGRFRYQL
jgi:hypothetical protein